MNKKEAEEKYITVVGAVNVDVGGISVERMVLQDSNVGKVVMSYGGVGRNVAHNMCLLGLNVKLITVFGNDIHANNIIDDCNKIGIDVSNSKIVEGERTSTYMFVVDDSGDMHVAINDMAIYDNITPAFLADKKEVILNSKALVVDTNIPKESIEYLVDVATANNVPVFIDPVSTVKAAKIKDLLYGIDTLKPNRLEAEVISGIEIKSEEELKQAAAYMLKSGVKHVFITLGERGVYAADNDRAFRANDVQGELRNATGCGDAFTAALVWSRMNSLCLEDSARAGMAASKVAMASEKTINPAMCASKIFKEDENL